MKSLQLKSPIEMAKYIMFTTNDPILQEQYMSEAVECFHVNGYYEFTMQPRVQPQLVVFILLKVDISYADVEDILHELIHQKQLS